MLKIAVIFIVLSLFSLGVSASEKSITSILPVWVETPSEQYPDRTYMAVVGEGPSQKEAEASAIESLAAIFSRRIESQTQSSLDYASVQDKGAAKTDRRINQTISISTNMEQLIGVEIKEIWLSPDGKYYALAVLEKNKAIAVYKGKIALNNQAIMSLIDIPAGIKNTIAEFARYKAAYTKAEENAVYLSVLLQLNSAASALSHDEKLLPSAIKAKWLMVLKNIPIAIVVTGDKNDKVKSSFAKVFSSAGFTLSTSDTSRYSMAVTLDISDEKIQGNNKVILRYSLDAALTDNIFGETVLPFSLGGREIHLNKANAEAKIFKTLDKKIAENFKTTFEEYITLLGK